MLADPLTDVVLRQTPKSEHVLPFWRELQGYLRMTYRAAAKPDPEGVINVGASFSLHVSVYNLAPTGPVWLPVSQRPSLPVISFRDVKLTFKPDQALVQPEGPCDDLTMSESLGPKTVSPTKEIKLKAVSSLTVEGEEVVEDIGDWWLSARFDWEEYFKIRKKRYDVWVDIVKT
ncbi:MAG: hypothetical protein JSV41_02910 [Gemmatimonadota bacterium]|nr:MAG: hypothetical protein JSV41_02910 [Gemmatimonadota bacterium]